MPPRQWFTLVKDAVSSWSDDYAPSMGAAIAYYTLFSLAPLLVLVIAVAGLAFGAEAVQGQISAQLSSLMGADTARTIEAMVQSASFNEESSLWATALSVGVLLIGATTVFAELQSALDRIWRVPESKKPSGVWALLRARLFSLGLILVLAFLLMVSLAVSAAIAAFGAYVGTLLPGREVLLQILNTLFALSVTTFLFAMIFKWLPTAKVAWPDVWVGAVVTAVLFEIGKLGIGLYLGNSALSTSYAGAGALVILVAWVYYAAQIFLLGVEFTKVYAHSHGSARHRAPATPPQLNVDAAARADDRPAMSDATSVRPVADSRGTASTVPQTAESDGHFVRRAMQRLAAPRRPTNPVLAFVESRLLPPSSGLDVTAAKLVRVGSLLSLRLREALARPERVDVPMPAQPPRRAAAPAASASTAASPIVAHGHHPPAREPVSPPR